MSCNEELFGSYRINNKTCFNKVIKAMIAAQQEQIDTINKLIAAYKSKTRNRQSVDWTLVEQCCPMKWVGSGLHSRKVTRLDLTDWSIRNMIKSGIHQRARLSKVSKYDLSVDGMSIDFTKQTFSIDVWNENHAVDRFNEQPQVEAFWKALSNVKWLKRGKDGGYCKYQNEYQDSPYYRSFYGRIGEEMSKWSEARPF